MPRRPRLDVPNIPQHIIQRGNDRQPCFFADLDRLRYLDDLREICVKVKKYGTVKICERRCRRTFALIEKARGA